MMILMSNSRYITISQKVSRKILLQTQNQLLSANKTEFVYDFLYT